MAKKDELRIRISAQDKASGAVRKVSGAIKGLVVAYLGFRGVRAAIDTVKEVTGLAMKQDIAVAKLNQQLKNHNELTKENTKALLDQASALQQQTVFADDAIISAQAMLASFNLSTEQMIKMTPRLLDVAMMTQNTSGQMQDLATTAKMVGVALGGQAGRLTQMGIKLSDHQKSLFSAASEQEKFNLLIKIFDDNAKGLATSVGATLQGRISQFKNNIGDLKEMIGNTIVKSEAWNTMISFISEEINKLTKWLQTNEDEVKEWGNNFAFTVVNTTRTVIDTLADLATAYSAVMMPILQVVKASSYLAGKAGGVREQIDGLIENLDKFGVGAQITKLKLDSLAELLEKKMREAVHNIKEETGNIFKSIPSNVDGVIIKFTELIDTSKRMTDSMADGIENVNLVLDGNKAKWLMMFEELRSAAFDFTVGWTDNIIDSIVEGKANFNEFVKDFLKGMTKMILKMLAFRALQTAFFGVPFFGQKGGLVPAYQYQHGGYVPGGAPYNDRIPAMLSPGEFIMRREAVNRIGADNLNTLNRGGSPQSNFEININMASSGNPSYDATLLGNRLEEEINELIRRKKIKL